MDYTYYADEGLHVETDDELWNPREEDDGIIGTMFCMHRRYKLGDKTRFSEPLGMKYTMLQDVGITQEKVIKLAKRGEQILHLRLAYNRHEKCGNSWSGIGMGTKHQCHTITILNIWKKISFLH